MHLYLTLITLSISIHGHVDGSSPSVTVTEILRETTTRIWEITTLTSMEKETVRWADDRSQDGMTREMPSEIVTPKTDIVRELINPTPTDSEVTEYSNDISVSTASTYKSDVSDQTKQPENNEREYEKTPRTSQISSSYEEFVWNCSAEGKKLCGCTETCLEIENCCRDSEFINTNIDFVREKNLNFACYSDFTDKWTLSSSNLLVNKCSKDWTDDEVRDLCEQPNRDDIQSNVPCYSPTTRLSYSNVHCLRCSGLNDYIPWEVTFQSGIIFDFRFMDSFNKMNDIAGRPVRYRGQQFVVSPKTEFEPAHCEPSAIKTCKPEVTTDKITVLLCQSYYSPVIVAGKTYRNIDCFECFTGIDRGDAEIKKVFRQDEAAMSVLLNVFAGRGESKRSRCSGSSCAPLLTHIRGFQQRFTVSINVTRAHDPAGNMSLAESSAIERLQERCITELESNLAHRLKKYDYDLQILKGQYDIWNRIPYEVRITIRDNIPIQTIPAIQKDILSLNFDLNIVDVMYLSCRLEEKGIEFEEDEEVRTITRTDRSYPAVKSNKINQRDPNAADRQDGVPLACLLMTVAIGLINLPII